MPFARTVAILLVGLLLGAGLAAPTPATLPPALDAAKQQYLKSVDDARAEMDAAVAKAQKEFEEKQSHLKSVYLDKLDKAIASETKKGDLDAALAIRAEKASVEGTAPADSPAATAPPALTRPGLMMVWDGEGKDGKPFQFVRLIDRIPLQMKFADRALPLKVPDGTPSIFKGFIRIKRDSEKMILNARADAWTQIRITIDDETILDLDNKSDTREFTMQRGLHPISVRVSGGANVAYQLAFKRGGASFNDYVYNPEDLTNRQMVK